MKSDENQPELIDLTNIFFLQSIQNESYDHHAAIYYLLQDRLSRPAVAPAPKPLPQRPQSLETSTSVDHMARRRPSEIAEQASMGNVNSSSSPKPENLQSLRDATAAMTPWTTSEASPPPSMPATEYKCLTCGGPILENTTSTTSCVKCARLRTRRRNFAHPVLWNHSSGPPPSLDDRPLNAHDSRDSGVSSGSSQDYGESTPPVEKNLHFPRFPAQTDRPTVPMSQLVRKLSEVEGITVAVKSSVDEGVDVSDSSERPRLGQLASFDSASLGSSAFVPEVKEGSFTSSTESYSYESFDDNPLTQSLPSCNNRSTCLSHQHSATPPPLTEASSEVVTLQPRHQITTSSHSEEPPAPPQFLPLPSTGDRLLRSPVNFREGRRASDGLSGFIAFQQRLSKGPGQIELNDVREEHRVLQSQFAATTAQRPRGARAPPPVRAGGRPSISKRISVPENFTYFPPVGSPDLLQTQPPKLALQQQLLQHRLHQKRQTLQKPTFGQARRTLTRQSPGGIKPYLPQESLPALPPGAEFLFQPIAEDEPPQEDSQWQTLPAYMQESCRLESPPVEEPVPSLSSPTMHTDVTKVSPEAMVSPTDSSSDNMDT